MYIGFSSMNTQFDPPPMELAKTLEERGYESLWVGEHSHIPVSQASPYPAGGEMPEPYKHMRDPYVSLMAAASVTTNLKLGTGIALLMERDVFSQAKTIATLDTLSDGRLLVGTGVGWNQEEFANVNSMPWNKRYAIMRETVAAMRMLWAEEEVEFHGEYVDFEPVWSYPKPEQAGGPPIVFGAMGPLGMKHAAQWSDGWMPVDVALGDVEAALQDFRQLVQDQGRQPDDVPITLQCMVPPALDDLKRYRDCGVHRVNVGVSIDLWDQPETVRPMIERFAEFIPLVA